MQTMNIASNPLKCIFRIIKNRKKEIVDINFRAKENKCLWRLYSLKLCFKEYKTSPSCVCNDWAHDIFNKGFLDNLYLRQSCHNCHFRNQSSGSDITIGDFWGIEKILSSKDNNKGISAIIVNTQKGKELSSAMPRIVESDYNTVQQGNMSLISSPKAHPMRNFFFQNYQKKGMIFTTLATPFPRCWISPLRGICSRQPFIPAWHRSRRRSTGCACTAMTTPGTSIPACW